MHPNPVQSQQRQRTELYRVVAAAMQQLLQLLVCAHARHVGQHLDDVRLAHRLQPKERRRQACSQARAAGGGGGGSRSGGLQLPTCSLAQDVGLNRSDGCSNSSRRRQAHSAITGCGFARPLGCLQRIVDVLMGCKEKNQLNRRRIGARKGLERAGPS